MDDIKGECGHGSYPFLNAVAGVFQSHTNEKSLTNVKELPNNLKEKNIFCSISSKAQDETIPFTWDKIDTRLCTHLLIDNTNPLISASIVDQLKAANSHLKIILTMNSTRNLNVEQWKTDVRNKKADGINIHIKSNRFSNDLLQQLQNVSSILSKEFLLTITFQLPTDPSHQDDFFNLLQLYHSVNYMILLPFDQKSITKFREIQPWNSLSTFIQADPGRNIGDYSMV